MQRYASTQHCRIRQPLRPPAPRPPQIEKVSVRPRYPPPSEVEASTACATSHKKREDVSFYMYVRLQWLLPKHFSKDILTAPPPLVSAPLPTAILLHFHSPVAVAGRHTQLISGKGCNTSVTIPGAAAAAAAAAPPGVPAPSSSRPSSSAAAPHHQQQNKHHHHHHQHQHQPQQRPQPRSHGLRGGATRAPGPGFFDDDSDDSDNDDDDDDDFSSEDDPDTLFERECNGSASTTASPSSAAAARSPSSPPSARVANSNAPGCPQRESGSSSSGQHGVVGDGAGGRTAGAAGVGGGGIAAQRQAAKCASAKRRSSEKFDAVMDTLAAQVCTICAGYKCTWADDMLFAFLVTRQSRVCEDKGRREDPVVRTFLGTFVTC